MTSLTFKKTDSEPKHRHVKGHADLASRSNMVKEEHSWDKSHATEKPTRRRDSFSGPTSGSAAYAPEGLDEAEGQTLLKGILSTFPPSRDWRTAWGISKALGYSEETVSQALEANADVFEVSPISPGGIALYRPRRA